MYAGDSPLGFCKTGILQDILMILKGKVGCRHHRERWKTLIVDFTLVFNINVSSRHFGSKGRPIQMNVKIKIQPDASNGEGVERPRIAQLVDDQRRYYASSEPTLSAFKIGAVHSLKYRERRTFS